MSRRADQDMDEDEGGGKRAGSPLDPRRLVRVVWRAKAWIVGATLVGLVIGVLVAKFGVGRSYLTSAVVRYEGLPGQSFLEAQQDLPSLASVALTDRFVLEMRERAGLREVHVDAMRAILQVSADQGTRQVSFNAYGETPEQAANLANGAVELFLQHHTELREAALRSEQASVAERISATSIELNDARTAYDTFRSEHGISEMNVEQSQVIAQAAQLRTEATLAAAEVEAARARVRQLTASVEEAPRSRGTTGGATNASRRMEDARVAELRQRLREARGQGLGDSHPQVQSLQRQVAALERQQREGATEEAGVVRGGGGGSSALQAERRANLETAQTELETLESRHATLEQLATAAEERGNRFSDIESQAASLLAQVNVKGALVESLTERAANIDDQLHDIPTGFRSVSNAIPPENAVPSKKKKIIALGVPLVFGLLALLVVVARDLNGLRLIAPPEIAWWGEGPVVATSSWPRNSEAFDDLLADLEELMRDKRGELLLVGATEIERQLAETLTMVIRQTWRGVVQDEHEAVMSPARSAQAVVQSAVASTGSATEPERHVIGNVLPMGRRTRNSPPGGFAAVQADDTGGIRISHALRVSTCTWDGQRGVAALRRAARRSDGVIVLVGAGIKASELRRVRRELALDGGVAFALLAVSDAVARQNDRAGNVNDFLSGFAG